MSAAVGSDGMMAESVEDVLAEMRDYGSEPQTVEVYAARIESALARERASRPTWIGKPDGDGAIVRGTVDTEAILRVAEELDRSRGHKGCATPCEDLIPLAAALRKAVGK